MDLDVITIGRSSVDLYGSQVGGRLEDMASFRKYIGGSPTNIAAGAARLGLKSAVITRVGDEHMGRFIREQLVREGVNVEGVITDPDRLTALAILGIRDQSRFPLLFYRENCADMALSLDDIDPNFIARAGAVVATGTHLYNTGPRPAVIKALQLATARGARTALDIDYRPNLWGAGTHDQGENRFVESGHITEELLSMAPLFDLIVGTEEEFHIAGGSTNTIEALQNVRSATNATLVCKRGPMGASAFTGEIPESLDDGESGPGFPIEVFNVLGAGDGFMAGLLRGWLRNSPWTESLKFANAGGALAVSRHGCTPAYPSWEELQFFFDHSVQRPDLRNDAQLEHVHWATNRATDWPSLKIFAFDHRAQLEEMDGATPEKIGDFKQLCLQAARTVAKGETGFGVLSDGRLGRDALHEAAGTGLWIGRPVEVPGSHPVELEIGPDFGSALVEWPVDHVAKVLTFYHPDDDPASRREEETLLTRLFAACRANGLELLVELIPSRSGPVADETTAAIMARMYDIGIRPDWWKLEPMHSDDAWAACCDTIRKQDPWCRGIVVLGLDAPEDMLAQSFAKAARHPLVKGFAIGRTIFAEAARQWLTGAIDDTTAVDKMVGNYQRLCTLWDKARGEEDA